MNRCSISESEHKSYRLKIPIPCTQACNESAAEALMATMALKARQNRLLFTSMARITSSSQCDSMRFSIVSDAKNGSTPQPMIYLFFVLSESGHNGCRRIMKLHFNNHFHSDVQYFSYDESLEQYSCYAFNILLSCQRTMFMFMFMCSCANGMCSWQNAALCWLVLASAPSASSHSVLILFKLSKRRDNE